MIKAALFGRKKKQTRAFKDYHAEWVQILKTTFIPLLSHSLSSGHLAHHVSLLHAHFHSYYAALDLAALNDVSNILHPDWLTPLHTPFIFLGDLHPNAFTNLLRSFLNHDESVWRNPGEGLTARVEQIECGLRLMVPALVARAREAQTGLAGKLGRRGKEEEVGEQVMETMEELTCVVLDANRLRRSVLGEILGAVNVHQAAVFLLALAQFVVGFSDADLLSEFKRCKIPLR